MSSRHTSRLVDFSTSHCTMNSSTNLLSSSKLICSSSTGSFSSPQSSPHSIALHSPVMACSNTTFGMAPCRNAACASSDWEAI